MKRSLSALTLISLVSCTSVAYLPVKLELPPKPAIPNLTNKELECVSQPTYRTLVQRDLAHNFYIGRLEAVIKATWPKEKE